ncbi:MAG: cyclic lactone autoinducer peptide [Desulfotomaculaceae bacterium]|nr:cyclic lactone autoinducer peptide [Desulfotomaculaceae bacterium]
MLQKIKKLMFSPIVMVALFVAAAGIKPASFFHWYQPEPPVKQ